jgi:serine/threonine-protein kinase
MESRETRALEALLTKEQLLACIEEQRHRAESLGILSRLADIAVEKDFISPDALEQAIRRQDKEPTTSELFGLEDESTFEVHEGPTEPQRPSASGSDFALPVMELELETEAETPTAPAVESTPGAAAAQRGPAPPTPAPEPVPEAGPGPVDENVLARLAGSGEVDSGLCATALTELAGESLVGKTILGYRLTFLIGEGPIGDVYKAEKQGAEGPYSLKLIPKRFFTSELMVKRFLSRMRVAARLEHPHVLRALEWGETPHHLCYVVSDYVEALPLWLLIKRHGRISEKMSLAIVRLMTRGLAHAHGKGMLHGNLKPSNVLVTPRGSVKVVDWGTPRTCVLVAAGKLNEEVARLNLISEGAAYLAPELIQGENDVVPPCDIYSVGAILYHLLTGRAPFEGRREEVLAAAVSGFPALPAGTSSAGTASLISQMTAKDPGQRPADAVGLLQALDELLKGAE